MPPRKHRLAIIGVACLAAGAGWYMMRSPVSRKSAGVDLQRNDPARPTPIVAARSPLAFKMADGVTLEIALDEVCVRGDEGVETFVKLDPPATPSTFRSRIAGLAGRGEILPVAYPENEERSEANRRLITRKMRVKISGEQAAAVAAANGLELSERPAYAPEWAILSAADPLAALATIDSVRGSIGVTSADVLTGRRRFARAMPNDTLIGEQWHLSNPVSVPSISHLNVESAWAYPTVGAGVRGRGIRIGIVDDGLQTLHPDFAGNIDTANGWDWNGKDSDPNPAPGMGIDRHGTACAGVAGARGNNGAGVSGVAPETTLVGMRLIAGSPTDQDEAEAMAWRNDIIQVKSNSWGPYDFDKRLEGPDPLTAEALATAVTTGRGGKGTVLVWAGGNGKKMPYADNSNFDGYANSIYTIAVGAIERTGDTTDYSERGANILVCAPAGDRDTVGTVTTDRTGSFGYNPTKDVVNLADTSYTKTFDGTSSATPMVSGVVALMLEKKPTLGWRDVQEILFRSATKVVPADPGWHSNGAGFSFHHQYGGGLANATAAVNMANTWTNLPAQTSVAQTNLSSVPIPENDVAGASKSFVFNQTNHRVESVTVRLDAYHGSRGNLAITLTSPSGMVSQLTEVRSNPVGNYFWTFSSVHHWGENAFGTWTVKVADRSGEGNVTGGTLGTVSLTLFGSAHAFPNQPPVVTASTLNFTDQGFADESLAVSSVSSSDPEGSPVTVAYQWQSGTNGYDFFNEPGETGAQLSISPTHAGKLWRCKVTPSDGTDAGAPYFTAAVNLLSRPAPFVKNGGSYSFSCGLVLPYESAVPLFRFATGSTVPDGLSLNGTTGQLTGTVAMDAPPGIHSVVIERYNSVGASVSQAFTLRVFPANYAQWIGGYSVSATDGAVDSDGDGVPNLIEYLLDLDPHVVEVERPILFAVEDGSLTLVYRQSKVPTDATLVPQWSTGLESGTVWQTAGVVQTVLDEDSFSKLMKAALPIDPADGKRFLRLKAEEVAP